MRDRCTVCIRLGGRITAAQADRLVELLGNYEFYSQEGITPVCRDNLSEELWADEIDCGRVDDVTMYCRENAIPFELWNERGGGYGEAIERFDGSRSMAFACDEWAPQYPMSKLLEVEALVSGLAEAIDAARFMLSPFPELEIIP